MKKVLLVLCLVFSFSLGEELTSLNSDETNLLKDLSADGKNEIRKQVYSKNGNLQSYVISRTNLVKGTYVEYYNNGNLKVFRIVN